MYFLKKTWKGQSKCILGHYENNIFLDILVLLYAFLSFGNKK
jgi:hypothetical protein